MLSTIWESVVVLRVDVPLGNAWTSGTEGTGGAISDASAVMMLDLLSLLSIHDTRAGRPDGV